MEAKVTKHGEVISLETRKIISLRYHIVTKAINREFWNSISDILLPNYSEEKIYGKRQILRLGIP